MNGTPELRCDLLVIGAGLAGVAGAARAGGLGQRVIQVGAGGGLDFWSGMIDLLGVHPQEDGTPWEDPWAGLARLAQDEPRHPLARLDRDFIAGALDGFTDLLGAAGLAYTGRIDRNTQVLTSLGTIRTTYRLPASMEAGARALADREPTLLVDFPGLTDYSAAMMVQVNQDRWPGLRAARVEFPGAAGGALYPESAAWDLMSPARREELARAVRPHLAGARFVGFPALLGFSRPGEVRAHLGELLGAQVFEVATPPPAIAGQRLRAVWETVAPELGVDFRWGQRVTGAVARDDGWECRLGPGDQGPLVRARVLLLAGGRFLGQGLVADRRRVREPLLGLPVTQPALRDQWHARDCWDRRGHGVNRAGLEVDAAWRPLGADGRPAHPRLRAAGAILAHHDWTRQKCGGALAIATAWAAVESCAG